MSAPRWVCALGLLTIAMSAKAEEVALFNGKDFTGWTWVSTDPGVPVEQVWSVKEGTLHCAGKPAGYLRTEKAYENYVLKLDWRWPDKGGNSGVLVHVQDKDEVWPKSLEAQLFHENAGDIWVIGGATIKAPDQEKRTEGRRTKNLTDGSEKPLGEWNQFEIVCKGDTLTIKVNGVVVNEATECSLNKGRIALQSEGTPVEFRGITLTALE
jgi:hypothetical protein